MTLEELIKHYQNRIFSVNDRKAEVKKIIQEIDNLIDTNQKPISIEYKKKILESLKHELFNESVLIHSQDNSEYLELIDQALKMLGGK